MLIQRGGERSTPRTLYDGDKSVDFEPYFRDTTRLPAMLARYRIEPGASEGTHVHADDIADSCTPHSSDELYLVTSGELVMTVDGERAVLRAGDAAYAPAGTYHGIANESDTAAEMVLVFGPPVDTRA